MDLGDKLEGLVGSAGFNLNYLAESREISVTPSLDELASLGLEAKTWAARLTARPAPNASLESARTAALQLLEALAEFHAWQVRMLRRFTPENIEDGSYQALSDEFGASLQPRIDALGPYFAQFNLALGAVNASLADFRTRIAPAKRISR